MNTAVCPVTVHPGVGLLIPSGMYLPSELNSLELPWVMDGDQPCPLNLAALAEIVELEVFPLATLRRQTLC